MRIPKIVVILLAILCLIGCGKQEAVTTKPAVEKNPAPPQVLPEVQPEKPPEPTKEEKIVMEMTEEELVGQLFLARYPGYEKALESVKNKHIGGYVLFGKDLEAQTPAGIRRELEKLQNASAFPVLIAVDEEGGSVTRVSTYPQFREEKFPSPRKLYERGGLELVLDTEREKCELLCSLGINVNLAPVCDVTTDRNAFMYSRSLGQSPEITGEYIAAVTKLMHEKQVGSVLKHFPGYGNNDDTHIGTALDTRPLSELEENDLIPFRAGIDTGCDAIMVSHTTIGALDDTMPGSLSPVVIGYLRETMGFHGVIMTDDLVMQAITDVYGVGESAVLAFLAGNDILCCSEYEAQYDAVLQAVRDGRISRERLEESVLRIIKWKHSLNIKEQKS